MKKEIKHLLAYTRIVRGQTARIPFSAPLIYDAIRLNLYTLAAKGITGFDSPVALLSWKRQCIRLKRSGSIAIPGQSGPFSADTVGEMYSLIAGARNYF